MNSPDTSFPNWVPQDHPARAVLARRHGKQRGRISYRLLEPDEYSQYIFEWESILGTRLIGIGEFNQGYELLFLASDGRCFGEDIVAGDVFYFLAESLPQFQWTLLFGRRGRPMLRPDQDSVLWYGDTVTRASPEIYVQKVSSQNA